MVNQLLRSINYFSQSIVDEVSHQHFLSSVWSWTAPVYTIYSLALNTIRTYVLFAFILEVRTKKSDALTQILCTGDSLIRINKSTKNSEHSVVDSFAMCHSRGKISAGAR